MDRVAELLDGWRTLAGWRRDWTTSPGHRKWNALVDRLNRSAEAAVADPADVARIRAIAERDEDPFVRRDARYWIHPWMPRPPERKDLDRWLRHPLVDLAGEPVTAEPGVLLRPVPGPDAHPDTWIAGEPSKGRHTGWPRRDDDIPLAHLVQAAVPDVCGLDVKVPGVLQFFHDLETGGDDRADGERNAWQVRHIRRPGRKRLARPEDLGDEYFRDAVPVDAEVQWTFPGDLETARRRVLETVFSNWGVIEDYGPVHDLPTMFGIATEPEPLRTLLPCKDHDDGYRLLIDVPGVGPLDGWIGDEGHLQFWIRESDLRRHRFGRVWAFIRG
ncbi:DUF1963 domain-containing protein [Actinoplanes sp. NEAU-A12]|uniref:DUF1963 domain-containing protein n=1 Tax=Actinoplanes sandaracinus TaxID=3045177 RepID=A0ABT6WKD8_9ACTN|nr:DUF1963 domain-containing protein [Actinoplanes sandaracinus]MDI6100202.1 DUF1963 domain-containing protein [Actinoplanes sandaracinus]